MKHNWPTYVLFIAVLVLSALRFMDAWELSKAHDDFDECMGGYKTSLDLNDNLLKRLEGK